MPREVTIPDQLIAEIQPLIEEADIPFDDFVRQALIAYLRAWECIGLQPLSLEEKRTLLDDLCGAWAGDSTIGPIFAEIEQERRQTTPREVSFDDPS
jgi:hypothetical protein